MAAVLLLAVPALAAYPKSPSEAHLHTMAEMALTKQFVFGERILDCFDDKLVIAFKSSASNFHRRNLMREIWLIGAQWLYTIFVAKSSDVETMARLEKESEEHQDMVMVNFDEHYYNLTLKSVSILNYMVAECPNSWVLVSDDDVIVDMRKIMTIRQQAIKSKDINAVYCKIKTKMIMTKRTDYRYCDLSRTHTSKYIQILDSRNPRSKWYIPESVERTQLPDFAVGALYMMSPEAIKILARVAMSSKTQPKIWLEDTYVTGYVRVAAGMAYRDVFKLHCFSKMADTLRAIKKGDFVVCNLGENSKTYHDVWQAMLDGN